MKQYKSLIKRNLGSVVAVALLSILTSFSMVFAGYSLSFLYTAYEYDGNKAKALLYTFLIVLGIWSILWNSAFRCLYLSFSPLPLASLLFSAICKASSDNHFAFFPFLSMGIVLIPVSCTMSQTSVHSSSGTLFFRSNPLNLFLTSTI